MEKMWAGRTSGKVNVAADHFNSSVSFDCRMYKEDIEGSLAHAEMLAKQGIITPIDLGEIKSGLVGVLADIESGKLVIDMASEDIHMFIESELTKRIGDAGKKLHTARSRNDQVATDVRLYLRKKSDEISELLRNLIIEITDAAEKNKEVILPGYTHLQRAQPISFGHHLLAYSQMFLRDLARLNDARERLNVSPLGSCALAGTTYDTDREFSAEILGFDGIMQNSLDGVSDRDFCLEYMSAFSIIMMHLSRLSEEFILWSSWEFKFIELDDAFTTGSSIMPQKKNSDMAELVRGKTGRVYGNLFALLTVLKGLPLAYNKDMQEDKEALFDSVDTVIACLEIFAPMVKTMKVKAENMYKAAQEGFINATDLADYLTKKGMPFRSAYKITGNIVAFCIENKTVLDKLPLDIYKKYSDLFESGLYNEISLETCVAKRISAGGTSAESVERQIKFIKGKLT